MLYVRVLDSLSKSSFVCVSEGCRLDSCVVVHSFHLVLLRGRFLPRLLLNGFRFLLWLLFTGVSMDHLLKIIMLRDVHELERVRLEHVGLSVRFESMGYMHVFLPPTAAMKVCNMMIVVVGAVGMVDVIEVEPLATVVIVILDAFT